jgi:hypothetical protein
MRYAMARFGVRVANNDIADQLGAALAAIPVLCAVIASQRFAAVAASGDRAEEALASIRPEAIRADMRFLSDDLLEGRGTGARGHELAAKFVAAQFEQMGLEPAGDGGTYFQRVPLREYRADEENTTVVCRSPGKSGSWSIERIIWCTETRDERAGPWRLASSMWGTE